VQQSFEAASTCLRASHKPLLEADKRLEELVRENNNPHLRYLGCIETRESVKDLVRISRNELQKFDTDWHGIDSLAQQSSSLDSKPEIVECPVDRTKLRVPGGRMRLLVTCPACKYQFVASTAAEARATETSTSVTPPRSGGLWQSVKTAFRRG